MAKQNRIQSTTIQFNVQGIQEIFGYQKKIKDAMKEIIAVRKQGLNSKVGEEYEKELNLIKQLENEVKRYGNNANNLQKVLENVGAASAKQLQQAEKTLKNLRDGIKFDGKKMGVADAEKEVGLLNNTIQKVHKQIEAIQAEAHNATGFKVMGKSVQQLNDYITNFEKNAQYLTSQMQNGKQVFAEWGAKATEAKIRMGQLDGTLLSVNKNTNAETLQAYIKGWQDIARYGGASAEQVAKANEHIAKAEGLMRDMMQRRVDNAGKTRLDGKELYSPAQVREAVEYMKQLSTSEKMTAEEREKLNASIKRGDEYLKQLTLDQQRYSMQLQLGGKQMSNIKTLSDASLASQKKYWTDMVASAERGTAEYSQYLSTLQAVTNEEQRRASQKTLGEGGKFVRDVNTGQFQGSIRETEEAIKKIQEYKRELKGPQQENMLLYAEQALTKLNEKLQQATTEAINGRKAFDGLEAAAAKGVDEVAKRLPNSTEELKRMRENLEAYKKSLKNPDTSTLQKIETMFTAIDKKQREVASSEIDWANYKGTKLKERSVAELKRAYEVLKKEIEGLSPAQGGYNKKAMQMREIDGRLKQLNKTMGEHKTSLENAASRLKNYVLIYFGFNKAIDVLRQIIQNTIALSDQMTNVRKVTGLTNLEIERMTNELQALDTRTANQQLMEMAEQAGKLGVATREGADGIVSFVKAGQEIVNTLGDIGGAEAITELLKVNGVVNKNATSIETDLGRIGSAILNIGNNSKATYADVTEFTKRLGATGSAAGLEMHEIMGLAGAYSSLGESMDRSATATQRIIMGIINHTKEVSQALNVSYADMDALIKNGQTLEAFEMALNALNTQGVSVSEAFFKAIGGRNNQQARAAITLLSQHIDELNYQVMLAKEGFEDGTLVTQEFEKANNNLAGVMARIQNELYEMTVSVEGSNGLFLELAKGLLEIVKWLRSSSGQATVLGGSIAYLAAQLAMLMFRLSLVNGAFTSLWKQMVLLGRGFKDLLIVVFNVIPGLFGMESAANRATAAMNRLKVASMTNWVTALAVAIGALVAWLWQMNDAAKETSKALGSMKEKSEEEVHSLDRLVAALRRCWSNQDERNKRITEFNKRFGYYYGYLLKETSSLNDLAIAYKGVAKAILEKNAAELRGKAESHGLEVSREGREEASGDIAETLSGYQTINKGKGFSKQEQGEVQNELEQAILSYFGNNDGQTKTAKGAISYLQNRYKGDKRFYTGNLNTYTLSVGKLHDALVDYAEATEQGYKQEQKDLHEAELLTGRAASKAAEEADAVYNQLTNPDRTLSAQEQYKLATDYLNLTPSQATSAQGGGSSTSKVPSFWGKKGQRTGKQWMRAELSPSEEKNARQGTASPSTNKRDEVLKRVASLLPQVEPWGNTSFQWDEQGGGDLASIVSYFNQVQKNYREGQIFSKTMGHNAPIGVTIPQDIDMWGWKQIQSWARTNWEKATAMQKDSNFDTDSGDFRHFSEGGGKKKERPDSEEALAELKRYYSDREEVIASALASGTETEEEYNRKKLANDVEFYEKEAQLRKYFDGTMNAEEEKRFKEWWASKKDLEDAYWKGVENLRSTKWNVIEAEWDKADAKAKGENRKLLQQDLTKRMTMLAEYQKKMNAALLDYKPMQKVLDDFRKSIDELDLLYGSFATNAERAEEGGAKRRMNILHSFLSKIGVMTQAEFNDELRQQKDFSKLTEEETFLLYERLLELRDKYDEAARKKARKEMKLLDNRVESGEWYEDQLRLYEKYLDDRMDALASSTNSEDQYRIAEEVITARTLSDYMKRRQNNGSGLSYVKQEKEKTEALKERIKTEESIRDAGVQNGRKIAEMEVQLAARNLKALKEEQVVRTSLYKNRVQALEESIALEKKLLVEGNLTQEEMLAHEVAIGNMETELAATRQMNEEATKEIYEKTLEAEREFIAKESALMSQRLQSVAGIRQGLNDSLKEVFSATSNVYESTQANIELEKYRLRVRGISEELTKTKYVIYNSKGVIEEVYLSPLEKLIKEQEIAIKNARSEAWGKYFDTLSEKLNEAIESGINRGIAKEQLKESEKDKNAVVEEMQRASLAIQEMNEKETTDAIYEYKMDKLRKYLGESTRLMDENRIRISVAGGEDVKRVQENEKIKQDSIIQTGQTVQNVAEETIQVETKSDKKKTDLAKTMYAAMIQGANLYGVAYGVVADQNLNTQQKVNQFMLQSVGNMINSMLSALLAEEIAKAAAGESGLVAKAFGTNPWAAAAIIAAGTAAIGAAMGLMMSQISKSQSQIASATGASSGAGKLATGMLTYAKGRYPVYADGVYADDGNGRVQGQVVSVRGDDGRDYMAKYQPQLRTGVVNGPHLGIVGEKGAELIVDHGTYEGLKRYDPETLRRIYAMKMYGQRSVDFGRAARTGNEVLLNRSGVRRYADGNVEDVLARNGAGEGGTEGMMAGMQETLAELTAVLAAVKAEGIQAKMEYLGSSGAKSTMDKGDRFLRRVGKGVRS